MGCNETSASLAVTIDCRSITSRLDLDAIRRLRYDVYAVESGLDLAGMDHDRHTLGDALDFCSLTIGAFEAERAVATVRCSPFEFIARDSVLRERFIPHAFPVAEAKQVVISRLMVRASHRGAAISLRLLAAVHRHLVRCGTELAFLECTAQLVPLYERLGARRYRSAIADPASGLMIPMVCLVGDIEHARKMGSPLTAASNGGNAPEATRLRAWFESTFGAATCPSRGE